MLRFTLLVVVCLVPLLGACARSRHDEVRDASRETQVLLEKELKVALETEPPAREARIDRLTSIKYQLSAANIALGAVPHVLRHPGERETAYTFLEEVYSTLSWNARLPAGADVRPLPANPMPEKLNFAPGVGWGRGSGEDEYPVLSLRRSATLPLRATPAPFLPVGPLFEVPSASAEGVRGSLCSEAKVQI